MRAICAEAGKEQRLIMNETNSARTITLKDLWDLFTQRILVIILAAVIAGGGFLAVDQIFHEPQYDSTATMYILRQGGSGDTSSGEAANELSLALRLVYDCNYFLKSRTVLNTVIDELKLDMSYQQLYSRISTSNPTNTRVLEITVRGDTPEQAKAIVDRICVIGPAKIEEAMGFSQVNLYEYGTLPTSPSNSPSVLKYGVAAIAAAVVVYGVCLLMFFVDDRIRTDEDIERILGLSVLAEIPDTGSNGKGHYGYYQGYGGYGYGMRTRTADGSRQAGKTTPDGAEKRG